MRAAEFSEIASRWVERADAAIKELAASGERFTAETLTGRVGGSPMSVCRCGHSRVYHDHYRAGSDCSLCECRSFRIGQHWSRVIAVAFLLALIIWIAVAFAWGLWS